MAKNKDLLVEEVEETVVYRKAKLWQIILYAFNGLVNMTVFTLIGMVSYSASIGYGIATVAVGTIMTGTRILDAITDPLLAFIYDRVNTRFGKIRILLISGWAIEMFGLFGMFHLFSSKGYGIAVFVLMYLIYVLGYTMVNITGQTIPPLLTNDPKQRPTLGVWVTVFNYFVPMTLTIILNVILLPKFGGEYNQEFLSAAVMLVIFLSFIGLVLVSIGVSSVDKPENFEHLGDKKDEKLDMKEVAGVLKGNRPLQAFIAAAASDKIAQQTESQAIVNTMFLGIIIGNMGLGTMLTVGAMLPSILFAIYGARFAGKHGNKESIIFWSKASIVITIVTVLFLAVIDTRKVAEFGPIMIVFILIYLFGNGFKMAITTANTAFMSDIVDYELDRTGRFIPAVITGTFSLIDKLISSVGALIATGTVALIGYTTVMPQPNDELTSKIFWTTMFLKYGLALIGWVISLIAMNRCELGKEEMEELQVRIAKKKAIERKKIIDEELA